MACQATHTLSPSTSAPLHRVVPDEPDYLQYAGDVSGAVARIARRFRLTASEAEDLESDVWVKLLADRGRALRRFRGAARIGTYLTTVTANVLRDRRNHEWGKWRPSAAAVRGGPRAVTIDRLISRDGLTVDQVYQFLMAAGEQVQFADVEAIAATLPRRCRRVMVGASVLESKPATSESAYDQMQLQDSQRDVEIVRRQLQQALQALPATDRSLIAWRYCQGYTVADIAGALKVNQKQLYRRFQSLLERLGTIPDAAACETLMETLAAGHPLDIAIDFVSDPMPARGTLRRSA